MKLSIVVPVYGVEKYIRECIVSIVNQNGGLFKEIELLIVNDGTKDKSIELIQDIIDCYDNITYIEQSNQGLSVARNTGIKAAKGEYVWCVDSDDWISPQSLEIILPLLDGKCDLIKMGALSHYNDCERVTHMPQKMILSLSGVECYRNGYAHQATSVLLVYRKNFLIEYDLWFMPGVLHEDNEFCPRVSYYSKKTILVPEALYIIRRATNDGRQSITTTVNPRRAFDLLKCMESLLRFKSTSVQEEDIKKTIDVFICQGINIAFYVITRCSKENQRLFNMEWVNNHRNLTSCLFNGMFKNKLEAILFTIFPNHTICMYKLLKVFG